MNHMSKKHPMSPSQELQKMVRAERLRSGSFCRQMDSIRLIKFTNIDTLPVTTR